MRLKTFLIVSQLLAVAVSICVLGIMNFYYMYQNVQQDVQYKNNMIAHATAREVADLLQDPVRMMEQVKAIYQTETIGGQATVDEVVNQIIEKDSLFESIELLDEKGYIIRTIPSNQDMIEIDRSRFEFHQKIKEGMPVYWSNSFISVATGRPTVLVAIPIRGGIIAGHLNLQRIGDITDTFSKNYGKNVFVAVTDAKGVTVAHTDSERVWQREWSNDFFVLHKSQEFLKGDTQVDISGIKYIASVEEINDSGWHVVVYQSVDIAFAVLHRIKLFFIITAVLVLIGGLAFSWQKVGNAVKAFARLNHHFMEIAAGKMDVKAENEKFTELNEMVGYVNHMIANIRERDEKLHELAHNDVLTGLGNRSLFMEWMQTAVQQKNPFAVVFLDLDNFKMVNDTYGHWQGDRLLVMVSEKLRVLAQEGTLLARMGGDEFVYIVHHWNDELGTEWINLVNKEMAKPVLINNYMLSTDASIGIAIFPKDSRDADELLRFADMAMYNVKNTGRNGYCFYRDNMNAEMQRKNEIVASLKKESVFKEFSLHYQPLFMADSKKIRGFEALLRWKNEQLGHISPAEFIPLAEESGRISEIGQWVMREACKTLSSINANSVFQGVIAINVSPLQFKNVKFFDEITAVLSEYEIHPRQVELEITESAVIDRMDEAVKYLQKCKDIGLKIALDDFGTGYSSLSYLHYLPIDTLKIDRALVQDVLENQKARAMLQGIVVLSKQIGLRVVAEGVETMEQAEMIEKSGCDYCQGYLLKKPMPKEELFVYIKEYCVEKQ